MLVVFFVAGLLFPASTVASSSITTVKLWVGNPVMTIGTVRQPIDSQGTKPYIVEGRTLVPIRAVIEAIREHHDGLTDLERRTVISC